MVRSGPRVVVIGGGIAGLAAAYALHRDGPPGIEVTVLEGDRRVGGKLRVSTVGDLAVDEGAEMFLVRVPEAVELARAVGLGGGIVHPVTTAAAVLVAGVARPLPAGTVLGVPADLAALRASGVLAEAAVATVAAEADRPGEPVAGDVAVGEYVRRRLGTEVVDRLVDPLLGGVYAGRADRLSLRATMPALARQLTAEPGRPVPSLVAAARAARAAEAPAAGAPVFGTLPGGLGQLPAAVAAASGARLRLGLPARRVERLPGGFRVVAGPVPAPTVFEADAVVVAVPAGKAAPLLAEVTPAASAELAGIEYASMAIVTLGYRAAETPGLRGSGLLVPAVEGGAVKAVTYSSAKWPHLAGHELTVLRASIGRHGDERVLQRGDEELLELAAAEVGALAGMPAPPVAGRVTRWGGALPQYAVGHVERVGRIRAGVAAVPGLAICGAAYEGVGVPACIRSGYAAAAAVLGHLAQPDGRTARRSGG